MAEFKGLQKHSVCPDVSTPHVNADISNDLQRFAGHISILPASYSAVLGTWGFNIDATYYLSGSFINLSGLNGDYMDFKIYLAKGTYTLVLLVPTATNSAIIDFDIDAVEVASFDTYSATVTLNVIFKKISISISTDGLKTLRMRVDGANASSTGLYARPQYIGLYRTA